MAEQFCQLAVEIECAFSDPLHKVLFMKLSGSHLSDKISPFHRYSHDACLQIGECHLMEGCNLRELEEEFRQHPEECCFCCLYFAECEQLYEQLPVVLFFQGGQSLDASCCLLGLVEYVVAYAAVVDDCLAADGGGQDESFQGLAAA